MTRPETLHPRAALESVDRAERAGRRRGVIASPWLLTVIVVMVGAMFSANAIEGPAGLAVGLALFAAGMVAVFALRRGRAPAGRLRFVAGPGRIALIAALLIAAVSAPLWSYLAEWRLGASWAPAAAGAAYIALALCALALIRASMAEEEPGSDARPSDGRAG